MIPGILGMPTTIGEIKLTLTQDILFAKPNGQGKEKSTNFYSFESNIRNNGLHLQIRTPN
jgi:hypothetical protein